MGSGLGFLRITRSCGSHAHGLGWLRQDPDAAIIIMLGPRIGLRALIARSLTSKESIVEPRNLEHCYPLGLKEKDKGS